MHTHIAQYHILQGVSFAVPEGGITVLLGRNGAGKTTCLRTIMGLWRASQGRIVFDGREHRRSRHAQHRPARHRLCAREHGAVHRSHGAGEPGTGGARRPVDPARLEWLFGLFPPLKTFWKLAAGNLSGGQKQMLSVARALIEPRRLILIDEPTKGLAPAIVKSMTAAIAELKRTNTTILLVEQNFAMARRGGRHGGGDGRRPHRAHRDDGGAGGRRGVCRSG